jgi:hypothetical protein
MKEVIIMTKAWVRYCPSDDLHADQDQQDEDMQRINSRYAVDKKIVKAIATRKQTLAIDVHQDETAERKKIIGPQHKTLVQPAIGPSWIEPLPSMEFNDAKCANAPQRRERSKILFYVGHSFLGCMSLLDDCGSD